MEVDIKKLIEKNLSLDGYFVLWTLYSNNTELLSEYCKNYKIATKIFEKLVEDSYITFNGSKTYTLDNIFLTDKFEEEILEVNKNAISLDKAFEQLREVYPKKTPNGRVLHQDLKRCKDLYQRTICKKGKVVDEELHSLILQCVNYIVNQKKQTNSLDYLQMLSVFLNQRNWEAVIEDVKKSGVKIVVEDGGKENKTQLGSEGF